MTDELLARVLSRSREAAFKRHTPAYRWLRDRYEVLRPVLDELDPPFREIAAEMAQGGIDGGRDKPLTAKALARIWQRLCRDLRAEAARAAETRPAAATVHPSRLPATWQPRRADPPRAPPAPRTAPPRRTESPAAEEEDLPPHVRAKLAALDAQLDWRDRFVRPPKRKE